MPRAWTSRFHSVAFHIQVIFGRRQRVSLRETDTGRGFSNKTYPRENEAIDMGREAIRTAARPDTLSKSSAIVNPSIKRGERITLTNMKPVASFAEILNNCLPSSCIQSPIAHRETGETQLPNHRKVCDTHPSPGTWQTFEKNL